MQRQPQFGDRLYLNDQEFTARQAQVDRGATQRDTSADSTNWSSRPRISRTGLPWA